FFIPDSKLNVSFSFRWMTPLGTLPNVTNGCCLGLHW
ncbi:MAG: hypothetical protein RL707_1016, partial [Pseudomonadota bacterium]